MGRVLPKIRVSLADAHGVVRRGLRDLLNETGDIVVVAEAENTEQIWGQVLEHRPDVVLLDMPMAGGNSLDVIRRLRAASSTTGILVLTTFDDSPYIKAALEAGANGYVTKSSSAEEIAEAVRGVYEANQALLQKYD